MYFCSEPVRGTHKNSVVICKNKCILQNFKEGMLSWKYYQYVQKHPINMWYHPTSILFAEKDNLQSREVVDRFAAKFGCQLTVAENSHHPFMEEADMPVVENWLWESI